MPVATKRARVVKTPEERRNELMDAAVALFRTKGLAATKVADVTRAARVSVGTFYVYFDSKEHLVAAIKIRFVDAVVAHLAPLADLAVAGRWSELLDTLVARAVDFLYQSRDLVQVFAQESPTPAVDDPFAEAEDRLCALFAQGIEAGCAAGALDVDDPLATSMLVHHAIVFTVGHVLLYGDPLGRDRLVAACRALVRRTLGLPERATAA